MPSLVNSMTACVRLISSSCRPAFISATFCAVMSVANLITFIGRPSSPRMGL
ncbi:MAG: hypothetical protein R2712_04965 [Vicinamibacterales bacterium]